jgi:hypothetical protein
VTRAAVRGAGRDARPGRGPRPPTDRQCPRARRWRGGGAEPSRDASGAAASGPSARRPPSPVTGSDRARSRARPSRLRVQRPFAPLHVHVHDGLLWTGLMTGLAVLCYLPSIIGMARGIDQLWLILLLSLAPIAWPAAVAGAIILLRKNPPSRILPAAPASRASRHRTPAPAGPARHRSSVWGVPGACGCPARARCRSGVPAIRALTAVWLAMWRTRAVWRCARTGSGSLRWCLGTAGQGIPRGF